MRLILRMQSGDRELELRDGETLLEALRRNGYYVPAACGGRGVCGKCRVRLLSGQVEGCNQEADGSVLACMARPVGDVVLAWKETAGGGLESYGGAASAFAPDGESGLGAALDVGTTTLAACLIDLESGKTLARCSALNPQGAYGADVLSRIAACADGKLEAMHRLILEEADRMLAKLLSGRSEAEVRRMTVSGNTTMLHLFCGVDPSPIGRAPYTPVFTGMQRLNGADFGVRAREILVLPSASGYIGSDITGGVLASGMGKRTEVLLDIGTNGEMVLAAGGRLLCTSTAAGPAFEGACIECGMGGVAGAVDRVTWDGRELSFTTIEGAPPAGICGSGLIDLTAVLVETGLVDESGSLEEVPGCALSSRVRDDRFYLTDEIWLSQRDIRQYQLAKSAVCAGLLALLDYAGVPVASVERLLLAGGLGYYIRRENAVRTGILPRELEERIEVIGNSSIQGASLCLCSAGARSALETLAARCEIVELASSAKFNDEYIANMAFL